MRERSVSRKWSMRIVYLILCLLIIFIHILPLSTIPRGWAGPDWIFALTFAWAGRRPDLIPILLLAPMLLFADIIFYRPPGLWALLVLVFIVRKKNQAAEVHDFNFLSDYLNFAVVLVLVNLSYRIILTLFFVERDPWLLTITQIMTTLLAYPLVVALSYYIFRIRTPKPGDRTIYRGLI